MSDTASADSRINGGAVTAPGAGATIASVTGLQSGARYRVAVYIDETGTIDAANIQNLRLQSGGANVGGLTQLPSVAGMAPIVIDQVTIPAGASDLTLIAIGAFAAASILSATIVATRIG